MRRALTVVVVLAACAGGLVLSAGGGEPDKRGWTIELDSAFGLTEGGDFRVAGVRAGQTTSIAIETPASGPPRAAVEVEATEPGIELRRDATCRVRLQSLIGEYFLDCQSGSSPARLPAGGTVPVERTEPTIPADLVNNVLRQPARDRLRILLTSLGMGVAGRPDDLQAVLRRAHPGLRETRKVLRVLGDQQRVIDAFLRDADTVVFELDRNRREAVRFVREAAETGETAASRRDELRAGVERLPGFLRELRPAMVRLEDLAGRSVPLADGLRRAAPDVETLLARLGPFAEEARPALRTLGDAAGPSAQALREGREEVRELRTLARDAPLLSKPLRQLLDSLDDRRRAVEDDPRAGQTGPPAPDPTHTDGNEGFTGFEAIVNYPFWQTLTTNGFDSLGHQLRVPAVVDEDCSQYTNRALEDAEDRRIYEKCNSWLGPNQPGLTAPDPSDPNVLAAARAGRRPERVGERRRAGEPDADALPGQRDISRPQVVLPPGIQELLDLGRLGEAGPAPPSPTDLLDFLLAP